LGVAGRRAVLRRRLRADALRAARRGAEHRAAAAGGLALRGRIRAGEAVRAVARPGADGARAGARRPPRGRGAGGCLAMPPGPAALALTIAAAVAAHAIGAGGAVAPAVAGTARAQRLGAAGRPLHAYSSRLLATEAGGTEPADATLHVVKVDRETAARDSDPD